MYDWKLTLAGERVVGEDLGEGVHAQETAWEKAWR